MINYNSMGSVESMTGPENNLKSEEDEINFAEPESIDDHQNDLSILIIAEVETAYVGDMAFETRIMNQLEDTKEKIHALNVEELPFIKRFGLAKLPKDFLY